MNGTTESATAYQLHDDPPMLPAASDMLNSTTSDVCEGSLAAHARCSFTATKGRKRVRRSLLTYFFPVGDEFREMLYHHSELLPYRIAAKLESGPTARQMERPQPASFQRASFKG